MQNPLKNRYVAYTLSKAFWWDVARIVFVGLLIIPRVFLALIGFFPGVIYWPIHEAFMASRMMWNDHSKVMDDLEGPRL